MTTAAKLRNDRASTTREAILTAAERLFAEHGVYAVSNRQVSEAAGQGNNAAVGYHFGTKADLVCALRGTGDGRPDLPQDRHQGCAGVVVAGSGHQRYQRVPARSAQPCTH